jgi:adenylate cyclase
MRYSAYPFIRYATMPLFRNGGSMTDAPLDRKLSAIMFSDIKGYSKMMGENEEKAFALLEEHNAILKPIIAANKGTILKFIGDAILSSYESASHAVRCAVEIQRALAERNKAEGEKILIRIGIHVGDVVVKDNDVFGDGVNIAARIEPLAEPGGICISQTVYDMVKARPEIQTILLGPKELKNIKEAVNIYRVVVEAEGEEGVRGQGLGVSKKDSSKPQTLIPKPALWALAVVLLAAAGWWFGGRGALSPVSPPPPGEGTEGERDKTAEEKFTILACPFFGMDEEAMKEGKVMQSLVERKLREELGGEKDVKILGKEITEIPRSHEEAKALGEKHNAAMVLWGEVLMLHGEVEIQPYMTVGKSVGLLRMPSPAAFQTKLNEPNQIILRKANAKTASDEALIPVAMFLASKQPDKSLQILSKINPFTPNCLSVQSRIFHILRDWDKAKQYYGDRLAYNPQDAMAHIGLGISYAEAGDMEKATLYFEKAIQMEPQNAYPRLFLGRFYYHHARYESALEEFRKALAIAPEDAATHADVGIAYLRLDRRRESAASLQKAILLDSNFAVPHHFLGLLHAADGQPEKAVSDYETAIKISAGKWADPYIRLGELYDKNGMHEKAAAAFGEVLFLDPKNLYKHLLYVLSLHRAGKSAEAEAHMKEFTKTLENNDWINPVARFYAGEISEADVLKAAEDNDPQKDKEQKCEAYYYLGMAHLLGVGAVHEPPPEKGAHIGAPSGKGAIRELPLQPNPVKAKDYFEKCLTTGVKDFVEYQFAQRELERMNKGDAYREKPNAFW